MEKLPPVQKAYEAWSALAGGRVEMGAGVAHVGSSNGAKTYEVKWDGDVYKSNDSASYWQGYAGYPVIAVLIEQGKLPDVPDFAGKLADIDWNKLNKEYKRDYAAAAECAFDMAGLNDIERTTAADVAQQTIDALAELPIVVKRNGRPAK